MNQKNKSYRIAILSMFIAIIIVQNLIPMFGYIPIGPFNLVTVHITVIIAAIILGPVDGAVLGGVWGLISFIRAFVAPTSPVQPIVFTNPLISILPRILVGLIAGYLFYWLVKIKLKPIIAMSVTAMVAAMLNTMMVLGLIDIFYQNAAVAHAYGVSDPTLLTKFLLAVVLTNGIPETILAGVLVPIICKPLLKLVRNRSI